MKLAAALGLSFALLPPALAPAQTLVDTRLRVDTWASGLTTPTTFAWIGPGEMLLMQKDNGQVLWIADGVVMGTALDLDVNNWSERGGLGIVADPGFATNSFVYVYFSASSTTTDSSTSGTWAENRVDRYEWNGSALVNPFGPIVSFAMDPAQANGDNNDGGVIRFGPDGKLYGVTGDLNRGRFGGAERVEQNTAAAGSAGVGGIFRLEPDGSIPADNPFVGEADPAFHKWWSYGMRCSFGLTFDAVTGELWDTENGPDKYDEVNRSPAGMNSGWLKIMGPDARDATYSENGDTAFDASDLTYLQNAVYLDPELSFRQPIGITAILFLNGRRFPEDLWDDCIVGDFLNGDLYYLDVNSARTGFKLPSGVTDKVADNPTERAKLIWGSTWGGVTDMQLGEDGYVYLASHLDGSVYRIRPVTDLVEPAEFVLRAGMTTANAQENVEKSDNKSFVVIDRSFSTAPDPFHVGVRFVLNEPGPTAVVVNLEDRYLRDGVVQQLFAWNVPAASWDLLDTTIVGTTDVARSIPLTMPSQYVDPADLSLRLRVSATPALPTGLGPGAIPPGVLTASFDLVRLEVTYP
jgi:glucose/arabinose dehydrogenase